jgi:hypothetical protein
VKNLSVVGEGGVEVWGEGDVGGEEAKYALSPEMERCMCEKFGNISIFVGD